MNALSRSSIILGLLTLLALGVLLAAPGSPAAADPGPTSNLGASVGARAAPAVITPQANISYVWNQFLNFIYNTFRSRERMIQLTLIGVVVGLFIMLRRMPGKV